MQMLPTAHGTESMLTNKVMVSSVQDVLRYLFVVVVVEGVERDGHFDLVLF